MRTQINNQAIQQQIKLLSNVQKTLKQTKITEMSRSEMMTLVRKLAEITGQLKAFNSLIKPQK